MDESLEETEERSVDEIIEGVRQALTMLDGSQLSTVAFLTGISVEKLIELGGVSEAPAAEEVRDRPGLPVQDPPSIAGDLS